jgi:hypothetical protein
MRARTRRQPSDRDQQPLTGQTPQSPWPAAGRLVQPTAHRQPICQPDHGIRARAGGRIGAVLLSPLIRPGTVSTVDYNHYSLLRTVKDIFGLPHLGDAAMPQVRSFGPDVFG